MRHRTLAPTTGSTHPVADRVLARTEFPDAPIDRAARQTSGGRRGRHTAKAMRQCLIRGKQSSAALVEKRRGSLVAATDGIEINHRQRLASQHRVGPSEIQILFVRRGGYPDSIISRQILSASTTF